MPMAGVAAHLGACDLDSRDLDSRDLDWCDFSRAISVVDGNRISLPKIIAENIF
jgi:hypothetical protein